MKIVWTRAKDVWMGGSKVSSTNRHWGKVGKREYFTVYKRIDKYDHDWYDYFNFLTKEKETFENLNDAFKKADKDWKNFLDDVGLVEKKIPIRMNKKIKR